MLTSLREITNIFEAQGFQIQDNQYNYKQNGVYFGDHPNGSMTLDIYISGELKKWFYLANWEVCLKNAKTLLK